MAMGSMGCGSLWKWRDKSISRHGNMCIYIYIILYIYVYIYMYMYIYIYIITIAYIEYARFQPYGCGQKKKT